MSHFNAYLKAWLVVVLGLFTVHSTVYSQTERMFSISLSNSLTLVRTAKQQALLERITQRETTAKVHIFLVDDITEMANSTALRFGTQNEIIYSLNNSGNKTANGSTSLWQGKSNASDPNMTTLVFDSRDITGSVWLHGQLYKIEPLGDGVHAFIEFDQSKALECGQPLEPKEESTGGETLNKSDAVLQTDPPVLDVLVAYTTAAKNASGNINSLIQLAVAEANQSYKNSGVTLYMNLVYTYEVSYTETGLTGTDLTRFTNTSDGYMDDVHTYRNQYGADICVLIISNADNAKEA